MSPTRRLAVILAADVVGYSRLMQADEAGTLSALKARRREILQPLISTHHGRIVKVMGEGGDLYGDGVNISGRLEALAEPGTVLVSQTVVSHVRGKVDLGFEDL